MAVDRDNPFHDLATPILCTQIKMLAVVAFFVYCNFLSVSTSSLSCTPSNFTCPGSVISCECQGAIISLRWIVTSSTGTELLREVYTDTDATGIVTSANGYTMVLCSVERIDGINTFTSRLDFTFGEDVSVECRGNIGSVGTATLQTPGKLKYKIG